LESQTRPNWTEGTRPIPRVMLCKTGKRGDLRSSIFARKGDPREERAWTTRGRKGKGKEEDWYWDRQYPLARRAERMGGTG